MGYLSYTVFKGKLLSSQNAKRGKRMKGCFLSSGSAMQGRVEILHTPRLICQSLYLWFYECSTYLHESYQPGR